MHTKNGLILVTGCSGLIGSRLVSRLAKDYLVVGLDVEPPDLPVAGTSFIECDLTSDGSVTAALEEIRERFGSRITSVVHLAAYYDFSGADSPLYDELTVRGTGRLLDRLQHFAVEQLVFSSSILVMKPAADDEVITEDSPMHGTWAYPQSKIETERLIAEKRGSIPVVILRIAGIYDEAGHSPPIAQQIRRIYERKLESYVFPGNKEHRQPFVHLDDAVEAIVKSIERRNDLSDWDVFLIAEPEPISYGMLQNRIGDLLEGHGWPTVRIPAFAAKLGAWIKDWTTKEEQFIKPWMIDEADAHYPVLVDKARLELGWSPRKRLWDVLPAIVGRLYHDPSAWYRTNKLGDAPPDARERHR